MNKRSKVLTAIATWLTVVALVVSMNATPVLAALRGDVSGDSKLDMMDALMLFNAASGSLGVEINEVSDIDGNGVVNMMDALAMYTHVSEKVPLPTITTTTTKVTTTTKKVTTTTKTTTTTKVTTTTKKTTTTTTAAITPLAHTSRYGRKKLVNASETAMVNAYDYLHEQVNAYNETINLYNYGLTISQAQRVIRYYRDDHPEVFWMPLSYSYSYSGSTFYAVTFDYGFTSSQIATYKTKLATATKEMLSGITASTSVAERARLIHNRLIQRAQYDQTYSGNNSHNLLGVLVDKTGVCESYALAYEYLLHQCGIQAGLVVGQSKGEGHMWNFAYINGNWYQTDVTWDDPVINSSFDWSKYYTYNYFNTTTAHINTDHTIQAEYSSKDSSYAVTYPIPTCTVTAENYQLKTATSLSSYNAAAMAPVLAEAIENGAPAIFRATGGYSASSLKTALENDMSAMISRINSYLSASDRVSTVHYISKVNTTHNTYEIMLG